MARRAKEAFEELRAEFPEVQAEYERLGPRFAVIDAIIAARQQRNLSQRDLAARMGVSQSVIARIESGENSPRIDTLARAAAAMDCDIEVRLKARKRTKR